MKDTPIVEGLRLQLVPLVEHVDTTSEQPIDDLIAKVKQVVLGDWFWRRNLVFKEGNVNLIFQYVWSYWLKLTSNQWGNITLRLF